jgi:protein transport protein SEC31
MKLKEIHRTSTFAWSPSASLPLLATGTVAGALDESFSNESQLEIWAPDFLDKDEFLLGVEGQHGPKGQVKDTARFVTLYYWQQFLVPITWTNNPTGLIVWHGDM